MSTHASVPDGTTPTRQCGRCRGYFPLDDAADPNEQHEWWACPTCAGALIPGQHRASHPLTP
jgi:hypothetical protein